MFWPHNIFLLNILTYNHIMGAFPGNPQVQSVLSKPHLVICSFTCHVSTLPSTLSRWHREENSLRQSMSCTRDSAFHFFTLSSSSEGTAVTLSMLACCDLVLRLLFICMSEVWSLGHPSKRSGHLHVSHLFTPGRETRGTQEYPKVTQLLAG